MRGVFKIIRRIFVWIFKTIRRMLAVIFKRLLYAIFLILLFIRKPVFAFLNFFAGGLALFLFFLFFGYTAGAAPYEHQTAMVIGGIIMIFLCLFAHDAYERFLLRLASLDYDLILISINRAHFVHT